MKIKKVLASKGYSGFFFDDQAAIKKGAVADGENYVGTPVTKGFTSVRQAGQSLSIIIIIDDGLMAYGDCAAVQYSGVGGRDSLFLADNYIDTVNSVIAPAFEGCSLKSFKELAYKADHLTDSNGKRIHTALRYGLTQALLDAVAKSQKKLMAEVVADEYGTQISKTPIRIFSQSGDNRYGNADKMIIKHVGTLPHGLFNHVEKVGKDGTKLTEYIKWLTKRIVDLGGSDYRPNVHIDLYGSLGTVFGDLEAVAVYIEKLCQTAKPFNLYLEGPIDENHQEKQMQAMKELTEKVSARCSAKLVADEWCNTLEDIKRFADNKAGHMLQIKTPDLGGINNVIDAVLYCKEKGIEAYQGGTCNETDRSAQICVHLAMATSPDLILAKPGMGVDEGYMICYNEMSRIIAEMGYKNSLGK